MRVARRLVHALVIVLTLLVGATAAAVIVSQTAWFKNWLRGYIVRSANNYLNGTLSIDRLGGNLFFGVEMENIGVSLAGEPVVAVKNLGLDYNVFELLTRGLSVDSIRLDQPVIYLRRDGDTWTLSRLVKKQRTEADRSGPAKPIAIEEIGVSDGSVVIADPVGTSGVNVPKRIDHLDARIAFKYEPVRYSIEITNVSFRGSEPALAVNALSGGVAIKDDTIFVDKLALRTSETSLSLDGAVQHYLSKPVFNLKVSSDKLSLPEIARLVPALAGVNLQPAFDVTVDGPLDRLGVQMNVRSSAGSLSGKLVADVEAPGQSVSGSVSVRNLNLAPILKDPAQKSDISADTRVDLRAASFSDLSSLRGSVSASAKRVAAAGYDAGPIEARATIDGRRLDVDARAAAYGARATARGRVTLPDPARKNAPQPTTFDLRGEILNVDLRHLPRTLNVPPAATNVDADYHVSGRIVNTAAGGPTHAASSTIGRQLTAEARFRRSTIPGATIAAGSTANVTLNGGDISYGADATVTDLDLEAVGKAFNVPALDNERYRTAVNGHVVASGRGTAVHELDVAARGTVHDSSLLGGTIPALNFEASLANDTAHLKADGTLTGFDPAAVAGRSELKGRIGGRVDVDATVQHVSQGITPDSVAATARVTLDPSEIGGLQISNASLDADYRDASGEIRTLTITGRDINVTASGTLALNDSGQSKLKVHADSPALGNLGKLFDVPLTGIGKLDATVTGNRSSLKASGNLTGDGVKYEGNGALTASTDFTATVPDLDAKRASVSADTRATFVSLAGQNINELTAKTTYANKQLDFDATARQPQRSLSAAGRLLLHPDHQEVHLTSLGLLSQGVQWQTASSSPATVNYAADTVSVEGLRLISGGNQEITADGRFGKRGDALNVTLKNIDVATIDALLLRPPQLSGRLDATAKITGTKANPQADARFSVSQGGFRQFRYDSLSGTASYGASGVDVDARLQQNPATWLTVKGYAPLSDAAAKTRYDLHVDSSQIDLGLIQGFTTALTNVTGTMQARVDVTGEVGDPRPGGDVTIQHAAFTVEPTGVTYTDLEGRIELQADKVHIDEIRVLDNHRAPLSLTGDLPIEEKAGSGVAIAIKADDFKVIDNKMGNVRVNSDLRIAGQLSAPRIEGNLGISTGVVNLDPILALIGDSAYATKATEFQAGVNDSAGTTDQSSVFDQLYAFVHVTVPNDLVIKANDIKAPGSPIGLGALNVTLGGDLTIHKAPWDQPRIYGDVTTIRGNYNFQSRRFEILRDGRVRFEGTDGVNPALDLKTQRIIQSVVANVNVGGTLLQPTIALSSTPPLDDADILSLIVFNQPINQLGEGAQVSLAQRAESLALGAAAGQLAQSVGGALGLDTFELNVAPENGSAASLTVGEQVGQNLFVKVEQSIGDQSQTNFILEYELTNWLRFRTNMLQGSTQTMLFQRQQGSGADLLFFFAF